MGGGEVRGLARVQQAAAIPSIEGEGWVGVKRPDFSEIPIAVLSLDKALCFL